MFKINKEELEINGKKLTLETGKIARQADGAIIATCGETVVLATVVGAKKLRDGQDFFPLSVNIEPMNNALGLMLNCKSISFLVIPTSHCSVSPQKGCTLTLIGENFLS